MLQRLSEQDQSQKTLSLSLTKLLTPFPHKNTSTPWTYFTIGLECLGHIYSYCERFKSGYFGVNFGQKWKKTLKFEMGPSVEFVYASLVNKILGECQWWVTDDAGALCSVQYVLHTVHWAVCTVCCLQNQSQKWRSGSIPHLIALYLPLSLL